MRQEELWDRLYSGDPVTWRGNTTVPAPNTGDALDLGCGNGKTVITLQDLGYRVTGVDFSSVAIDYCRRNIKDAEFIVGDVTDLPFGDRSFDYVTAVHVLEHLDDPSLKKTVSEIERVVRPGGYVFVRSFTPNDMRSEKRAGSDIFYRFYDIPTIRDAFDGFEFVSAELIEEPTRFRTVRSRVEALMRYLP